MRDMPLEGYGRRSDVVHADHPCAPVPLQLVVGLDMLEMQEGTDELKSRRTEEPTVRRLSFKLLILQLC